MNFNLKTARKIITNLVSLGEISRFELNGIAGGRDWLALFETAGVVRQAVEDNGAGGWSLSPGLWSLIQTDFEKAVRTILFQIPEYRNYLISILAEGLASAAKQGLLADVEKWSGNELLPFLPSINRILDEIETNGYRLIDGTSDEINEKFNRYRESKYSDSQFLTPDSLNSWNQLLLGRTARPQDLFDFVLKRFVPYAVPESSDDQGRTPAILPVITLPDAHGSAQHMNITPAPWNIRRKEIQSGIALFDGNGKPLWDFSTAGKSKFALQDALIEQPFYKAVIQLAINHYRAKAVSLSSFELYLRPGAELCEVELFYETGKIGLLKEWLPVFVQCQDCFAASPLNDEQVVNMMENLLALDILDQSDDTIVLHSDFQSTLMAGRLRSVFRPGKSLQERMIQKVKGAADRSYHEEGWR